MSTNREILGLMLVLLVLGTGAKSHADELLYDNDGNLVAQHFALRLTEAQADQIDLEKKKLGATAVSVVIRLTDDQVMTVHKKTGKRIGWLEVRTRDMARFFCACDWQNAAILRGLRTASVLIDRLEDTRPNPD